MNLNKLKKRGFEVHDYHATKLIKDKEEDGFVTKTLIITLCEDGSIILEDHLIYKDGLESSNEIRVGEVNSIEQFLVFYDVLNACNANGNHKL